MASLEPDDEIELGEAGRCGAPAGGTQAACDLCPGFDDDRVDGALGDGVAGYLIVGEDGLELGDEIGGGDDLFAEGAQELDGAGIDHGDIHDVVHGRVLHGDFLLVLEEIFQTGAQFLPA